MRARDPAPAAADENIIPITMGVQIDEEVARPTLAAVLLFTALAIIGLILSRKERG